MIGAAIVVQQYVIERSAPPKYPTRADVLYDRVSVLEQEGLSDALVAVRRGHFGGGGFDGHCGQ
jgi:hypothetical protein